MWRWQVVFGAIAIAVIAAPLLFALPTGLRLQPPFPGARELGNPPKSQTSDRQQHSGTSQQNRMPTPAPGSAQIERNAQQNAAERKEEAPTDWWLDWFTGGLVCVGILQLFVFGDQARKLRESIDLTRDISDRQERDTRVSIAEAARAASEMERVAIGIAESVENTRKMSEDQREFWQKQMRAYASVRFGAMVNQDIASQLRFEARMIIINTGHTPAHNVCYRANAAVMPFPLPADFDFPLPPESPIASAGMLAPQQTFIVGAVINKFYPEEEAEIIRKSGEQRVFAWGTVNYVDAFGVDRFVNFSQNFLWLRDNTVMGYNTRRHNDAN
jgi:hypothetical protein